MTDKIRNTMRWLYVLSVVVGLAGWLLGLDPAALLPLIGPQTVALGLGEASNGMKRWTADPDVIVADAEAEVMRRNGGV